MIKNPPCNGGIEGSIPGQGTKIPHAEGQLSLCAEPAPQLESRSARMKDPACRKEDPMYCSLPDSFVHGDFQGKNIGMGCHTLLQDILVYNIV